MFDVDKVSDFEEAAAGGPADWQQKVIAGCAKEDYGAAMAAMEAAMAQYEKSSSETGRAACLLSKAKVLFAKGSADEAKGAAAQALEKYKEARDAKGEASVLHTLAKLELESKSGAADKAEAMESVFKMAQEALELFKGMPDKKGQGAVLNTLAKAQFAGGLFDEAQESAEKALALFQDVGEKAGAAASLLTKATVNLFWGAGNWEEASKLAKQAIEQLKGLEDAASKAREADAWMLVCSASIPAQKGGDALAAAKSALAASEELGGNFRLVQSLRALAFAQAASNSIDDAVASFDRAKGLADGMDDKHLRATVAVTGSVVQRMKMMALKNAGKPLGGVEHAAVAFGREAVDLFTQLEDQPSAALTRVELAQAMMAAGDVGGGLGEASVAKDFFESSGNQAGEAIAFLTLADGLQQQPGQQETAYGAAKRAQELFTKAGGGEGTKAAGELLDVLEADLRQKRETGSWGAIDHGTFTGDNQGFGGISRATYTKLFAQTMHMPDRPYEVMLDAPLLQGMEAVMASMARQAADYHKKAPQRGPGGAGGARSGAAPKREDGQQLRRVPLKEPERFTTPVARSTIIGTDQLGGRSWDCPEDVHVRMLELAARGDIPLTRPEQRGRFMNKRPTFYGAAEWKEAVKNGYIHPDLPAPKGLRWRKVTMGWKLL